MTILIAVFVSAGAALFLWCILGWCLHFYDDQSLTVLFLLPSCSHWERKLRYHLWLRKTGLLTGQILLVDCGLGQKHRKAAELLAKDSLFVHLVLLRDLDIYFTFTRADYGTGI